jgi:hypothetical protein
MTGRSVLYRAGGLAQKLARAQVLLDELERLVNEIEVDMRRLAIRITALNAIAEDEAGEQ